MTSEITISWGVVIFLYVWVAGCQGWFNLSLLLHLQFIFFSLNLLHRSSQRWLERLLWRQHGLRRGSGMVWCWDRNFCLEDPWPESTLVCNQKAIIQIDVHFPKPKQTWCYLIKAAINDRWQWYSIPPGGSMGVHPCDPGAQCRHIRVWSRNKSSIITWYAKICGSILRSFIWMILFKHV